MKYSFIAGEVKPMTMTLTSGFMLGCICIPLSVIIFPFSLFTSEIFFRMIIASLIDMTALVCLSKALTLGVGGPVGALCSIQTIVHTVLNMTFY